MEKVPGVWGLPRVRGEEMLWLVGLYVLHRSLTLELGHVGHGLPRTVRMVALASQRHCSDGTTRDTSQGWGVAFELGPKEWMTLVIKSQ